MSREWKERASARSVSFMKGSVSREFRPSWRARGRPSSRLLAGRSRTSPGLPRAPPRGSCEATGAFLLRPVHRKQISRKRRQEERLLAPQLDARSAERTAGGESTAAARPTSRQPLRPGAGPVAWGCEPAETAGGRAWSAASTMAWTSSPMTAWSRVPESAGFIRVPSASCAMSNATSPELPSMTWPAFTSPFRSQTRKAFRPCHRARYDSLSEAVHAEREDHRQAVCGNSVRTV